MKKIIGGKKYDTETAESLASWDNSLGKSDFGWATEELFRKNTGEYFLYGEGGPASAWKKQHFDGSFSRGEKIVPFTEQEAREWAEDKLDVEEYEKIFGPVEE